MWFFSLFFEEMDFVLVGGGSAGALLANRLAKAGRKVLLLEAGSRAPFWTRVPIGYLRSIGNPSVDWCFWTEPEKVKRLRRVVLFFS
jgi:choline dehydrogenase